MGIEEIEKELVEVQTTINSLVDRRVELETMLKGNPEIPLSVKFSHWLNSQDKEHLDWNWVFRDKCPLSYNYIENNLERYREYELGEYFEEFFEIIENDENNIKGEGFNWIKLTIDEVKAIANELITTNVGSFTCDW